MFNTTDNLTFPSISDVVPLNREFMPKETPITIFASGHGWTSVGSAGSSVTDDTSDFIFGSQSVRLETGATTSNAATVRKTGLSLDMTGKYLVFYIKVDNPNLITSSTGLRMSVSSSDFSANFRNFDIAKDMTLFKPNEWQRISVSWGDGADSGSGVTRSSIAAIQFRIITNSNTNVKMWVNNISLVNEPSKGICTITFDDGIKSSFTKGKGYMDKYGFRGVAYIIPDLIDSGSFWFTSQDVEVLYNQGWDVAVHNTDELGGKSNRDVQDQLRANKQWLKERGYTRAIDHYAYAGGDFKSGQLAAYRRMFRTCRSIIEGRSETIPPADPYRIRCINVTEADNTTTIASRVTQAINNKEWIVLVFHGIVDSGATGSAVSTSKFQTIIDDIATQGITVRTLTEVINGDY